VLRQLRDHYSPNPIAHELASPDGLRASPEKTASASQRKTVESTKVGPNRRLTTQPPTLHGSFSDDSDSLPLSPASTPVTPVFALVPLNPAAQNAVNNVRNVHFHCFISGTSGLWLDFSNLDKQVCTLGSDGADIYLPSTRSRNESAHICAIHASFQVVEETGAVLLYDHSEEGTVEPLLHRHCYTVNFRSNAKSVLVARGVNEHIAFGRVEWYQFEIHWVSDGLYRFPKEEPYSLGPRNAISKSYLYGGDIGTGSYSTVLWALDTTNGKIIAVKKFHDLLGRNLEFATRRIANFLRINRNESIKHVSHGAISPSMPCCYTDPVVTGTHPPDPRFCRGHEGRRLGRDLYAADAGEPPHTC